MGDTEDPSTQASKPDYFVGSLVKLCSLVCFPCALIYCKTKSDVPISDLKTVYKTVNVIISRKASVSYVILLLYMCCQSVRESNFLWHLISKSSMCIFHSCHSDQRRRKVMITFQVHPFSHKASKCICYDTGVLSCYC